MRKEHFEVGPEETVGAVMPMVSLRYQWYPLEDAE